MRIFVTGATGFVGRPLCHRLLREGHEITAFVRNAERARGVLGPKVRLIESSADDAELSLALSRCAAIINLAGEGVLDGRWTKARRMALYKSRIETTRRLVKLLAPIPGPPSVLVSASAVGYYGVSPAGIASESSTQGSGFLARLCGDWEEAARGAAAHGVRVVHLRTGVVLGRSGGALTRLLPLFRRGLGGRMGDGEQAMSWIHIHDMIELILSSVLNTKIVGAVNAVSPSPVSNQEFSETLAAALGTRARLPVPAMALKLALGRASSVLLGGQRAMPRRLQNADFVWRFPTLEAALHDLVASDASLHIKRAGSQPPSPYLIARPARYELRQETTIDAPLPEVFDFFSKAENLGLLTPPNLGFQISSPVPIAMGSGTRIDYIIRLSGIPMRWQTEIESYQRDERFVDVQERGPYRSWWHQHSFRAEGNSTIMSDRVLYVPPLGPLGWLANRLVLRSVLTEIFDYRSKAIQLHFAAPTPGNRRFSLARAA